MRRLLCILCLFCPLSAHAAARVYLLWDFPRTAPQPSFFLITLESLGPIAGTQQLRVAGVTSGVCKPLPTPTTPDTFCTEIRCPGPGHYRATVEAFGRQSNTIMFGLDAACQVVDAPRIAGPVPLLPAPPLPCQTAAYLPPPVPQPPLPLPAPITITVEVQQPHTTPPPVLAPAQVQPPPAAVPLPTIQGLPPRAPDASPVAATATVYAGPVVEIPAPTPPPPAIPTQPCP